VTCRPALVDGYMTTSRRFQVVSSLYNLEAGQKLGTGCDSCCIVGDIVERSPRYLVTEVLNMWEVSMEGSHIIIYYDCLMMV
jgi:hypothetical protein